MKLRHIVFVGAAVLSAEALAMPPPPRGYWRPGPVPMHYHHGYWGRGGRYFWPGFVGGVVGGAIIADALTRPAVVVSQPATVVVQQPAVVTQPVVVQQPVVTQPAVVTQPVVQQPVTQVQNVGVDGRYVDQVQANGAVVRIWQPGHYEQRTVVVQ